MTDLQHTDHPEKEAEIQQINETENIQQQKQDQIFDQQELKSQQNFLQQNMQPDLIELPQQQLIQNQDQQPQLIDFIETGQINQQKIGYDQQQDANNPNEFQNQQQNTQILNQDLKSQINSQEQQNQVPPTQLIDFNQPLNQLQQGIKQNDIQTELIEFEQPQKQENSQANKPQDNTQLIQQQQDTQQPEQQNKLQFDLQGELIQHNQLQNDQHQIESLVSQPSTLNNLQNGPIQQNQQQPLIDFQSNAPQQQQNSPQQAESQQDVQHVEVQKKQTPPLDLQSELMQQNGEQHVETAQSQQKPPIGIQNDSMQPNQPQKEQQTKSGETAQQSNNPSQVSQSKTQPSQPPPPQSAAQKSQRELVEQLMQKVQQQLLQIQRDLQQELKAKQKENQAQSSQKDDQEKEQPQPAQQQKPSFFHSLFSKFGANKVPPAIYPPNFPPPPIKNKKTLILDMDETLIHSSDFPPHSLVEAFQSGEPPFYVFKRPGLDDFLKKYSQVFDLFIFTYGEKNYASPIIDVILPSLDEQHRLFRDSCTIENDEVHKDIDAFKRPPSDIILIEDNFNLKKFHPHNTIIIPKWAGVPYDKALVKWLPDILDECAKAKDVRKVINNIKYDKFMCVKTK